MQVARLRGNRPLDDGMEASRDEVIRLQGRIRTIISQVREVEASNPQDRGSD